MYVSLSSSPFPIFNTLHIHFAVETAIMGWGRLNYKLKGCEGSGEAGPGRVEGHTRQLWVEKGSRGRALSISLCKTPTCSWGNSCLFCLLPQGIGCSRWAKMVSQSCKRPVSPKPWPRTIPQFTRQSPLYWLYSRLDLLTIHHLLGCHSKSL